MRAFGPLAAILILIVSGSTVYAQTSPKFEVSLLTGNRYCDRTGTTRIPSRTPQRIAFEAAPVANLMAFAYDLPVDKTEKWPQWMYDNCYSAAVTTTDSASLPKQKQLLQKLLEEKFGLVAHRISYHSNVYYLVPGPKVNLMPAQDPDVDAIPDFRCNNCVVQTSLRDLARWLNAEDHTGITGMFDIGTNIQTVNNLPVLTIAAKANVPCVGRGCQQSGNPTLDRLGLKLELHTDGTAESMVIDHIEQPRP